MMDGKHISRFEAMAQRLIEGSFSRFFGGRMAQQEIANRLMRAMEESYEHGQVATHYDVYLHPDDYQAVNEPGVEDRLSNYLVQLAQRVGLLLPERPTVTLVVEENLRKRTIHVATRQNNAQQRPTQQLQRSEVADALETVKAIRKLDAFFIIDGRQHVPLDQPLVTLGRRTDNDIILNSPSVSRKHAQVRWRSGHFVIYDLGSNMGTQVNGTDMVECVLHPGDVIRLSDVSLIYGEGATTQARRKLRQGLGDDSTTSLPAYRPERIDGDDGEQGRG
ncbi:MAG: DUF3662 domain-containing protein [Anaerolineales bacterium]|nr:DUF3662 domain-containing protein [Anaerolineales bacterium]